MKKNTSTTILLMILLIAPLVYLGIIWNQLPDRVAVHFNLQGDPDRYGSKNEVIVMIGILFAVNLGVYALLTNLGRIDPKKTAKLSKDTFKQIALGIVMLTSFIAMLIIYSTQHGNFKNYRVLFILLGLFFAYLGNLMYSIKPNYFVGIRTPWTLESPEVWRKTHQWGSKIFFVSGLLVTACAIILPTAIMFIVSVTLLMFAAFSSIIYSYILYKRLKDI